MKKIIVGKNEGVAEVVERIIGAEESEIILSVPKDSTLSGSGANFHLIRREAQAAQKSIAIESVDDSILVFAKESGIEASHPFFDSERRGSISDIVPAAKERGDSVRKESPDEVFRPQKRKRKIKEIAQPEENFTPAPEVEEEIEEAPAAAPVSTPAFTTSPMSAEDRYGVRNDGREETSEEPRRFPWKLAGIIAAIVVAVFVVMWAVGAIWGHATVTIDFQKTPWVYSGNFVADSKISKINLDANSIPAELFTPQKNLTKLFPASASKNVSQKAQGTITIYNAYSSASQSLVATTRFVTPDGKIFRITGGVVVPGAQITSGKITPASIDAPVVADQAGPDYNVGPIERLTIPGFKGSPKYEGFYGELKSAAQGGFIGQKAVPTADDIQKAKANMASILKTTLQSSFLSGYPADFKILDGASNINVTKLTVNENTDAKGNFSVFGEATISAVGFCESEPTSTTAGNFCESKDLRHLLALLATKDNPGSVFNDLSLSYSGVRADLKNGSVAFTLAAQGTLKPDFSAEDFKTKIAGKSVGAARSMISELPGLSNARVSIWPVWFTKIPGDFRKIQVVAN